MKILHLNTYSTGGAAIACLRIHEGLLQSGLDSKALFKYGDNSKFGKIVPDRAKSQLERYMHYIRKKLFLNTDSIRKNKDNVEIFTTPFSFSDIENQEEFLNSNIIHLHWVADFIDFGRFFKTKKKIVWTIHDLNPFMGGLHYTVDEGRISRDLLKYEYRLRKYKHHFIKGKGIHFVFLSKWLFEEACKVAPWLRFENVHFLYNGIDTKTFHFSDSTVARTELGLPKDKKIILFISENVQNYRKGFDILNTALAEQFLCQNNLYAIALGNSSYNEKSYIHFPGLIMDPTMLQKYYSAADVYVLPSRQDNLPNVMLEALVSGCPVVAFNTGGMKECINSTNGKLFTDFETTKLQKAILESLESEFNRTKIASDASAQFNVNSITEKYFNLYNNILKEG